MKPKLKKIAVIVESSRAFGRDLIKGISNYASSQNDWQIYYHEATLDIKLSEFLQDWQGDGLIVRLSDASDAEIIVSMGIPAVDLLGELKGFNLTTIDADNAAISRLAVDFFLRAGFSRLAFCGYPGIHFSDEREKVFMQDAEAQGASVSCYHPDGKYSSDISSREAKHLGREWVLSQWLQELEKPVAIFACNDVRALQISAACRVCGIDVPSEVSILGVDNDELICGMSQPPLSSIQPDAVRHGWLGAETLLKKMEGHDPGFKHLSIPPVEVVERASTDIIVFKKIHVCSAVRFIRRKSHESIGADDVAEAAGVSRSLLDRDFKDELGHTISEEIARHRLTRICHFLAHTPMTLQEITEVTGFSDRSNLSAFFKSHTDQTPGEFRSAQP